MTNYEREATEFEKNFACVKHKRIVLYGVGRHTATLVPMLHDNWNIVGLMDRNPEYIGKQMFGLPVLNEEQVENEADLIIINTSGAYWQIIFQRIEHLEVPVYYQNGKKAQKVAKDYEHIEYWDVTQEKLLKKICEYEVISFDFYDTLFQRKVYLPSEVFYLVALHNVDKKEQDQYIHARKNACVYIGDENAPIDRIYDVIQRQMNWTDEETAQIKAKEIELEMRQLTVRSDVLDVLKYAIALGKEIYIISDMYLPQVFFETALLKNNINLKNIHIWVSCEKKASKENGVLWKHFKEHIGSKKALHIGDNLTDDIQNAYKYKIEAFYCMSKNELMAHSSLNIILPRACSQFHMMILGLCENRLFDKAFDLGKKLGRIHFARKRDFGYVVLGPVLFSFLFWIRNKVLADNISYLVFLGRDGYFLKEDYEYLCQFLEECSPLVYYMETSRQILMYTCMESKDDFFNYVRFPYKGSVCDYAEDRFGIILSKEDSVKYGTTLVNAAEDYDFLVDLLQPYMDQVRENILKNKKYYQQYIQNFMRHDQWASDQTAVVDLGYYGTNQYYLSRIIKQKLRGYYMMADLSRSNINCRINKMDACACDAVTRTSNGMNVYMKDLVLESFLTSPLGMIKGMQDMGEFLYDTEKNNQYFFEDKVEINEGIKSFIQDMMENYSNYLCDRRDICIDDFVDQWYGKCIDNSTMDESIKRSFYNDNAFIHRGQERVFE